MVDCKGFPINTKKQIYAQAFAIYALSEYYLLSSDESSLKHAQSIFGWIEQISFDPVDNGYFEAFDRDWNLLGDLRLSEKDANEKKTMNTHLHVLEAYTNLYRCWRDDLLLRQLKNLIGLFTDKIIGRNFHFRLFFDEKWNVRSDEISYGHDIEGSWLLYEAATVSEDKELIDYTSKAAINIVNVTVQEGLDQQGGVKNEAHNAGKDWWPQAEAMVGLVNAWQISGRKEYLDIAAKVWTFVKTHIIDHRNGEWFWGMDQFGSVNMNEDKAGPWKCPYHNGRAMLELAERLSRMK
jgi:mannobiose 2-epimerase